MAIIQTITSNHYVHVYNEQRSYGAIPLLSSFPLSDPSLLPSTSFYLLGTLLAVIGSRPPWSKVARKLISPFPSPPHSRIPTPWGFLELNAPLLRRHRNTGLQVQNTSRVWWRLFLFYKRWDKVCSMLCQHVVVGELVDAAFYRPGWVEAAVEAALL